MNSIPYMGSKRRLALPILKVICARHSNITDFYDLFGGGAAVALSARKHYRFKVHYNEINPHVFHLLKYLTECDKLDKKFYEWVTREEFFRQINRQDADWYSGYVKTCWSFGNHGGSYLYGSEIDGPKRLAHEFIVNGDLEAMKELGLDIPQLNDIPDMQKRRQVFCLYIEGVNKKRFDLQRLQSLESLESLESLQSLQRLQSLESLESLESLQSLLRLQSLESLELTNLSYEQVEITGAKPVIYCDIPYKGTADYGGFDHEKFYKQAADCLHPVYISEYNAPFIEVDAFSHRSTVSAINNSKRTIEKLFWNGKGNVNQTKLFP